MIAKNVYSHFKNLPIQLKCSAAYVVASVLTNGISFLTTPIFTRIMSTHEMGVVTSYNSWQVILSAVVGLALSSGSFSVAMIEFCDRRDEYISSIMGLSITSSVMFSTLYLLFRNHVNQLLNLDTRMMLIMLIGFIVSPSTTFFLMRQRFEYKYKSVLLISVLSALFSTLGAVLFVIVGKNNGEIELGLARIIGRSIPIYLIALAFIVYEFFKGKIFYCKEYWLFSLKLSLPLIIHTISKHILDVSDRIMIDGYLGKSELGIYGVLYTISSLSVIIWTAINSSLVPMMFNKLKSGEAQKLNEIIKPLLLIYAALCCLLSLLSPEIVTVLATKEYYSAVYLMPPISCGIFFTSLYTIYGNILTFYKKTNSMMLATLSAAIVNIILNYYFIPIYGAVAASYTTLVAYITLTFIQLLFVKTHSSISIIENKFLLGLVFTTIIWSLICNILYKFNIIRLIIILVIILYGIFNRKEIKMVIKPLLRRR